MVTLNLRNLLSEEKCCLILHENDHYEGVILSDSILFEINNKGIRSLLMCLTIFGKIVIWMLLYAQSVKMAMPTHSSNVICVNTGFTKIACLIFMILILSQKEISTLSAKFALKKQISGLKPNAPLSSRMKILRCGFSLTMCWIRLARWESFWWRSKDNDVA